MFQKGIKGQESLLYVPAALANHPAGIGARGTGNRADHSGNQEGNQGVDRSLIQRRPKVWNGIRKVMGQDGMTE